MPGIEALSGGNGAIVGRVSCATEGNCAAGGYYFSDSLNHRQAFVVDERDGRWGSAIEVPGTATLNSGGFALVRSLSCVTPGNCAAGGTYDDGSGHGQAFVVDERNGTWGTAIEVPGTAALNSGGRVNDGVTSVSCATVGNCAAVGTYTDGAAHIQAFVVDETNGNWGTAIEVPGTATLNAGGWAEVYSLSCATAGNCAAGGRYRDGSDQNQAFLADETNGSWGTAIEVPGTATLNSSGDASVQSVSCATAGNCAAAGTYFNGHTQAFVDDERNGVWGNASESPGPNATDSYLFSISCATAGNCATGGTYTDSLDNSQALIVNERNGIWGNAKEAPGTATLNTGGIAAVNSVSCPTADYCAAAGYYASSPGHTQAFVDDETNGTWSSAIETPGTATLNSGPSAGTALVSCATAATCAAAGYYTDSTGHTQAFVANSTAQLPAFSGCPGVANVIRPHSVLFACGDRAFFVNHLHWSRWTATTANAIGIGHQNNCTPNCQRGHFHTYPGVSIHLHQPQTCTHHRYLFTRVTVRYTKRKPRAEPHRQLTVKAPFLPHPGCP